VNDREFFPSLSLLKSFSLPERIGVGSSARLDDCKSFPIDFFNLIEPFGMVVADLFQSLAFVNALASSDHCLVAAMASCKVGMVS